MEWKLDMVGIGGASAGIEAGASGYARRPDGSRSSAMMEAVMHTENGGIVQKAKLGMMEAEMEAIGVMEAETINGGGNHDDL